METIVLGFDGSETSVVALDWVAERAAHRAAQVEIVMIGGTLLQDDSRPGRRAPRGRTPTARSCARRRGRLAPLHRQDARLAARAGTRRRSARRRLASRTPGLVVAVADGCRCASRRARAHPSSSCRTTGRPPRAGSSSAWTTTTRRCGRGLRRARSGRGTRAAGARAHLDDADPADGGLGRAAGVADRSTRGAPQDPPRGGGARAGRSPRTRRSSRSSSRAIPPRRCCARRAAPRSSCWARTIAGWSRAPSRLDRPGRALAVPHPGVRRSRRLGDLSGCASRRH